MRRSPTWAALTAAAVVGLACNGEGDSPGGGGGGVVKVCDTRVRAPKVVTLGGQVAVQGTAQSTCDVAPQSLRVIVWLEMRVNGDWTVQNRGAEPNAVCYEIPPGGNQWIDCDWIVFQCQNGAWRTRVLVSGVGPNGRPFTFAVPEKPRALIRCPRT